MRANRADDRHGLLVFLAVCLLTPLEAMAEQAGSDLVGFHSEDDWLIGGFDTQSRWVTGGLLLGLGTYPAARPAGKTAPTFMVGALRDPGPATSIVSRPSRVGLTAMANGKSAFTMSPYPMVAPLTPTAGAGHRSATPSMLQTQAISTRSTTRSCAPPASTRISIPSTGPFYYARVREIPTPTWQAYDSKVYSVDMLDTIQMKGQDRAYTSPICYTP